MKIHRRQFLYGVSASALVAGNANAGRLLHGTALATAGKAQANLNAFSEGQVDFPFVNCMKSTQGFEPSAGTLTQDPWSFINADGYFTGIPAGCLAIRANAGIYYIDAESFIAGGSVTGNVLTLGTVTGKPLFTGQTIIESAGGTSIPVQTRLLDQIDSTHWHLSKTLGSPTGTINIQAFIPWVLDFNGAGDIGGGIAGSALVFPPRGWGINSNRQEFYAAAIDRVGATFTLNVTAGSQVATLTSIVGTPFNTMSVTGAGIPPNTLLVGSPGNWFLQFSAQGFGNNALSYDLVNVAATGHPIAHGDPLSMAVQFTTMTSQYSNIRIYRQDQESLLATQILAPHFKSYYQKYGRLRYMNWAKTNGNLLANWEDRLPITSLGWYQNSVVPAKYAGQCPGATKNQYVGPNTYPGNPSSWVDKQLVQFSMSSVPAVANWKGTISGTTLTIASTLAGTVRAGLKVFGISNAGVSPFTILSGSGTSWTIDVSQTIASAVQMAGYGVITGMSNAAACVITSIAHGASTGDRIAIPYDSANSGPFRDKIGGQFGPDGLNFDTSYSITVIDADHFSIPVDTTSYGSWPGGGNWLWLYEPMFKQGSLPFKHLSALGIGQPGIPGFLSMMVAGRPLPASLITGTYDATLDMIIYSTAGNGGENEFGMPFEAMIQTANELNGPDLWLPVPAFATDSFITSMATAIKTGLNSNLKWDAELSNEVWNTGVGFWQTPYAEAVGRTKWSILDGTATSEWFGWRWYNMIQQINTVYGSSARGTPGLVRIFSFREDETNTTIRITAPLSGIPVNCLDIADELCFADYFSIPMNYSQWDGSNNQNNSALPDGLSIYNYQQYLVTGNTTLRDAALNAYDAMYNAFSCGPLFAPITGFIDDGTGNGSPSGVAGTVLTVTAISPGTNGTTYQPANPRLGPYTVIGDFGGSHPAVGTYITSQLSSSESGSAPNKRGRYQLAGSSQLKASTSFSAIGSAMDLLLNTFVPSYLALATAHGVKVSFYEGGLGDVPSAASQISSYSGNPLNIQDSLNLTLAYKRSAQYSTTLANYLAALKALGATYSSAYCLTNLTSNPLGLYGMTENNIFGADIPAKAAFDAYNNS